jgi:hypothetical protein
MNNVDRIYRLKVKQQQPFFGLFCLLLFFILLAACVMPVERPTLTSQPPTDTPPVPTVTPTIVTTTPTARPTATPGIVATSPPDPLRTQYNLKTLFDPAAHHLKVAETIVYANSSQLSMPDLVLLIEANRTQGVFQLDSITWADGKPVKHDKLIGATLRIPLTDPLLPGAKKTINLTYQLFLPVRNSTLGANQRQTNFGEWFPFVPHYQVGAGWLVYKPSGLGEYLAYDVADYQVEIQLSDPKAKLVIAANAQAEGDVEKGYHYRLDAARNFVWSASSQMQALKDTVGEVTLYAYIFPEDQAAGKAALKTMREAIEVYSKRFGPYPHNSLTMVEASFYDGMEYDGLYFLDQQYFTDYAGSPESYLVTLNAHETAHQWWYGLVGSDSAMEPWLDESLCTYSELLFYEQVYPKETNWWWQFRVHRFNPTGWVNSTIYEPFGYRTYVNAVYLRGALFLQALREQVGDQVFFEFLKDYAHRYRQGWATGADFFNVLGDHTQVDLTKLKEEYFIKP